MLIFEVCAYLFKFKSRIPDFERGKAIRGGLTTGIYKIFHSKSVYCVIRLQRRENKA